MPDIFYAISMLMTMIGFPFLLLPLIWLFIQFINVRQSAYRLRQWQRFALSQGLNLSQRRIPSRWHFSPEIWPYIEGEYAGHSLQLQSYAKGLDTFTELSLTAATPPLLAEADLDWLRSIPWAALKGWISAQPGGQSLTYRQGGFESNPQRMEQVVELLVKIAAVYPSLLKLGAAAVPNLRPLASTLDYRTYPIRPLVWQLLRDIAQDTHRRLGVQPDGAICRRCLSYPRPYQVILSLTEACNYWGCRVCGQSQDFLYGRVVAVLDTQMEADVVERDGWVEVNWLRLQTLFDFGKVDIRQASDEQVERLMMQIGNDTDPFRRPRYPRLNCTVGPNCSLSMNSLKLLERFLGKVHFSSPNETAGALPQAVSARRKKNATHLDHESIDTQTLHSV
jgi:hypothetical protein